MLALPQDATINGEQVESDAAAPCSMAIQDAVKYGFRWNVTLTNPRFSRSSKYMSDDGTMTLSGHAAEAENGLGNWLPATYRCRFDVDHKAVVNVTLEPGGLPD